MELKDGRHKQYNSTLGELLKKALIKERHSEEDKADQCLTKEKTNHSFQNA